ncbi:MAG: hypothetical protein WBA00_11485 [Rhodococcus sp. (in: high G+C Gram-positive bacteria)]
MGDATLIQKDSVSWQATTNIYRLEPPHEGVDHVAICVSTELHCDDETIVFAATESGAARPHPETGRWWVLSRFPDDTPHEQALTKLGYDMQEV